MHTSPRDTLEARSAELSHPGPKSPVRAVSLVGCEQPELVQAVSAAARAAGCVLDDTVEHAAGTTPSVVLVPFRANAMAETAVAIRGRVGMEDAVLVALAPELDDVTFEESLAAGIDDCCLATEVAVARTLRGLAHLAEAPISARKTERVLVVDASPVARGAIARAFGRAGFTASFASSPAELTRAARDVTVAAVIVSASIAREIEAVAPFAEFARALNPDAAWIINTPPSQLLEQRSAIAGATDVAIDVHDAFASPDTLLFVANAMWSHHNVDMRRTARVLYGTCVQFRSPGQTTAHVGHSYNVSRDGLYVRTVSPPDVGESLWLELVPPRSPRRVHLEAKVVWRRRAGAHEGAVAPPGFGVAITGATERDRELFERGYDAFVADRGL